MSRMRGGTITRRKKTTKLTSGATPSKTKTKKLEARGRVRGAKKRAPREERDEDEDEDARGRFEPPAKKDSTPLIIAIVAAILLVVGVAAMAGGGGSNLVDEHEAEKAFIKVDGAFMLAKGGEALAENRTVLRQQFQRIIDAFPNTEAARKAKKRLEELQ